MAYEDLKLIKCFRFDKYEKHWDTCDGWVEHYEKTANALYTFTYGEDKAYIVYTYYSANGKSEAMPSGDINNHSLDVSITPIAIEDAEDEEKVKSEADAKIHAYGCTFDVDVNVYSESDYTHTISPSVFQTIDKYESKPMEERTRAEEERKARIEEYRRLKAEEEERAIAEKEKRAAEAKKESADKKIKDKIIGGPNAVKVYKEDYEPDPLTILNFDSETTLAEAWYLGEPCSSVGINRMDNDSIKLLGIDRSLCYFYPIAGTFGRPEVSTYIRHDGKRFIPVYFSNNWDTGGSAVICAYVKGKPAPLTEAEVQKILDFVKDDAK